MQIPPSTQQDAEKFKMKVFGNNDVKAVLHRLDRLTFDEALPNAVQIFEVIHGLIENLRKVMDGEQVPLYMPRTQCQICFF